jgi:putative hemolysin
VDINISNEELLQELSKEEYRYSRIPVYDETIDEIKGILNVKDLIKNMHKKSFKIKNIMNEAYFVPQNKLINELFRELQINKIQMAIIVDEYGGTAGLVTMEDILEEIVGEIYDEYDEVEDIYQEIDENTFILSGSMAIYEVEGLLNIEIEDGDYDTLSGYLIEELGRIPSEKEKKIVVETPDITYKIEEIKDKRITRVKACKNNPKKDEIEEE